MSGTRGGAANGRTRGRIEVGGVHGARKRLTGHDAAWAGAPGVVKRINSTGVTTPEELETLFEDALVIRDGEAVAALFGSGAVLVTGGERPARGEEIAPVALATWAGGAQTYVAAPRRIVLARDIALIVTERGVNVARRGQDGCWRYAIVVQAIDDGNGTGREERET